MKQLRTPDPSYRTANDGGAAIESGRRQARKKPDVLMIVENSYPNDPRVRKEAQTLKNAYDMTVIALRREGERFHETVDGVDVFRIPEFRLPELKTGNKPVGTILPKARYMLQYLYFTLTALLLFSLTYPWKKYRAIHLHNPPDTLFLVGLIGKLFNIKLIYDHHDLSPELYLTRFSRGKDIIYKTLILCERLSCRLSDAVITTNKSYRRIELARHNIKKEKVFIVRNDPVLTDSSLEKSPHPREAPREGNRLHGVLHPNPPENSPENPASRNGKKRMIFLGSVNPQDGVDILIRSLHYLVHELHETDFTCTIVGDGDSLDDIRRLTRELKMEDFVDFTGYVSDRNMVRELLESSDIGVEPAPGNPLNDHSTFIKVMEYMAAGRPVVAFDLDETRYSTDGAAVLVTPGNIAAYAEAIKALFDNPETAQRLGKAGFERIRTELNWETTSVILNQAYRTVFQDERNR